MAEPGTTQNTFNIERLHDYGRRLAHSQSFGVTQPLGYPLRAMLEESREVLLESYHSLAKASLRQEEITPGAQWLLDNFYLIKDQMREVQRQLPRKYYLELPKLSSGLFKGLPRVYEIMHELADLVDNAINQQNVRAYVEGYQEVDLLRLGELWALPSMLRIVLLQNLHTRALQLRNTQQERQRAHDWAQRILKAASSDPVDGLLLVREMTDRDAKYTDVFIISLAKHLQGQGPTTAPVLDWIERRLQARHVTLAEIVQIETQRQTQRQVSIANAITTLRWATETNWKAFVESLSGVERTLCQDPAGVYPQMDFKTRDRYRHRVEEIAKYSSLTEFDVAERALSLAQAAGDSPDDENAPHCQAPRHVGTYLIGEAMPALEIETGYQPPFAQRLRQFSYRHPTLVYLASILTLTALAEWATLAYASSEGATPIILILIAACAFLPFLDFAVALTNRFVAHVMPPNRLPKLDFEQGIPAAHRSMVVVPTLISSPEEARQQAEHLEIHALANPHAGLRFALLTDFPDAPEETMPGDAATLEAARKAIAALNERYCDAWGDAFFLLHRERRWNEAQGVWMGWERKRGKLEEFNTLLRKPAAETSYTTIEGDFFTVTKDDAIRYVITLDADTRLPPGSAVDLVRTAAHPLNEPYYDPQYKRVTKGYGILQPRVSISLEGSARSAFARIYSGNVGLDIYTTAVSDVYQDLFGVGIFTGKGLYEVDAFRATLEGAIPANTVLSHDLLEGNYARAALVSDIEVFDDYPSSYIPFAQRLHRWVRGDWQILSWLLPVVRDARDRWRRNPISTVGKWKILDNLRRSLTGPALLLLLLLGWIVLPSSPFLWTGIVLAVLAFPIYVNLTTAFLTRPQDVTFTSYFQSTLAELKIISLQTGLTAALLVHQSVVTLDAIVRTLWRMFASKKHLLDWVTAHQAERSSDGSLRTFVQYMWTSIAWGGLIFMLTSILDPRIWFVALPFAVLWIVAPWIAYRVSKPTEPTTYTFTSKDTASLRLLARHTWRYFDRFVNGESRWLPPDNFQEEPYRGLARRTSPTNMGLALLAMQAAYDLGYLSRADLIHRLAESLGSIRLLERYAGHFYNWYSTDTGEVMYPHYVSTVDSGNMAASLIALRQALYETRLAPWPNPAFFDGLRDTLAAFKEDLTSLSSEQQTALASSLETLEGALPLEPPATLAAWKAVLDTLTASTQALAEMGHEEAEMAYWQAQLVATLEKQREALAAFAPWLDADQTVPEPLQAPTSLRALRNEVRRLRKDEAHATLHPLLDEADTAITDLFDRAAQLITWCDDLVESMDFSLLYNTGRGLFTIGYNVDTLNADAGMYDLLASEARLASYVAIGKGDVPVEHWFRLGRPLASLKDRKALLSWSGTMFEYLMPLLLMRSYPNTLLEETSTNVVRWHIQYGRRKGLPWGISESAYNALNLELDYQYRAFGVPGLGLKRGLSEDYVVAPYATVLALLIDPEAALDNLETLREEQAYGSMGYYDAIDYTKARLFTGQDHAVVRTYMAHHQGMILLAAQNVLTNNLMRRRFHAAPNVRASELLLQERTSRKIETIDPHPMETEVDPGEQLPTPSPVTYHGSEDLTNPTPHGHLLSNGSYTTFISNAGAGYSSFNKWAVTRWSPDRTTDDEGFFIYVRDLDKQTFWSVGHQPVQRKPDRYDVWFHLNKAEFARVDDWVETFMEVCVSPEDNMEVRRLTLTNYSDEPRRLEVTSYAEVVINEQAADQAHPAFSKLFVQTEYVPEHHALLATRRQRSEHDLPIWLVHTIADDNLDLETGPLQIETDRARFIGRGRTLANPVAMDPDTEFSGTTGSVLDPIVSLRRVIELKPKERIRLTFSLGTATSRQEALRLTDQYDNPPAIQRAVELATVYGNVETRYLGITGEQAMRFQQLSAALLYGASSLRAPEDVLLRNRKQQPGLWAYGISGDLPVVVVQVAQMDDMDLVRTVIKAHEYWKLKNLKVDVVFLNEHPPSYVQELQDALVQAVQTSHERGMAGQQGGFFVLRADQIAEEDLTLIHTVAAAVLEGTLPSLLYDTEEAPPEDVHYREPRPITSAETKSESEGLQCYNGYGGFSQDGSAYIIRTSIRATGHTPLPWINVLANEQMGCLATESGAGYTWSMNSRENRLTPWSNDPITDPVGEALYIRDEDSSQYWSPTPHPAGDDAPYETEHGFGYTTYRHQSQQIDQETTVFVTRHDPVKIIRLRLTNRSDRDRTLSVFRYQEWVLGVLRAASARYVATSRDADTGAVFAQNWYNHEFAGRVAFAAALGMATEDIGFTTDLTAFLGRNGSVRHPLALRHNAPLDGRTGAGFDPCAVFSLSVTLAPEESADLFFLLGEAATTTSARTLLKRYQDRAAIEAAFEATTSFWTNTLSRIQVETPAPEMDVLLNGWLLYQDLACRVWARSAFYQSGGAYGFRDQLQDVMALVYTRPDLTREQILRHAAHQFVEGDVLHWWHPPTGRGIRSRFSDDLLWLPLVTAFYIHSTGDIALLEETEPYLTARQLEEGEDEAYLVPTLASEQGDIYDHCCRALDRSLTKGPHGLPLMGSGDWNDGMNRVGHKGRGESVWLGFFLYHILNDFLPFCEQRGDEARIASYRAYMKHLKTVLNDAGWDGQWYRRAYYDDGAPLGSKESDEAKIDAIAQAWSIISGVAPPERAQQALAAVEEHLIDEDAELIKLLTPPFDKTPHDPGYIKGYIPGVRENGGQYTHAALWVIDAFALSGQGTRAFELYALINPINHANTPEEVQQYKVEPYVVTADIYSVPPHVGRGGWSWYTGSAGWMYRIGLESILGLQLVDGTALRLTPCIPAHWPGFTIQYRLDDQTLYIIRVENPHHVEQGVTCVKIDGASIPVADGAAHIPLEKSGKTHQVQITLG